MERKQKRILVLCSFAVTILIILTILSLLAPHGEDFRREKSSGILEGQLQTEEGGIYLQAEVSGEPALLGRGEDAGQWVFTVEESGDYYLSAGYMALEGNGQELEFSLLLDGSKVTDSAVTLTRTWTDSGQFKHTASGDEIRPAQTECTLWTEEPFRLANRYIWKRGSIP